MSYDGGQLFACRSINKPRPIHTPLDSVPCCTRRPRRCLSVRPCPCGSESDKSQPSVGDTASHSTRHPLPARGAIRSAMSHKSPTPSTAAPHPAACICLIPNCRRYQPARGRARALRSLDLCWLAPTVLALAVALALASVGRAGIAVRSRVPSLPCLRGEWPAL